MLFATNNAHKLQEARQILPEAEIMSLAQAGINVDIPETEPTLEGNALLKARHIAAMRPGVCVMADDTGLEVEALGGAPGVMSARFASEQGHDSAANMRKLLQLMQGVTDRRARFRTIVAMITDKGETIMAEGIVSGTIAEAPSGNDGFGYDPIFIPAEGDGRTFAEMTADEKNAISHRSRALHSLKNML